MKTNSSREERFIISILAGLLKSTPPAVSTSPGLDWAEVRRILFRDRLAPMFYTLQRKNLITLPESLVDDLRQARYVNLIYGDRALEDISEVLRALLAAHLPVLVLKGWAYIQWLYGGDHSLRFCEDIDLLVPPEKIDQAEKVLQDLGYHGSLEVVDGYSRDYANARSYSKSRSRVANFRLFSIGLHWGLTHFPRYDPLRVDVSGLFVRALPLQVAGVDVLELSPEDGLIYACAHLALHHRNQETYLNYYEIAALLQRSGRQPAMSLVIQRSQQWQYFLQVRHVLRGVERLFPGSLADEALPRINSLQVPLKERWVDWLVAGTGGHRYRAALLEILFLPSWRAKIRAARLQLIPPASYLKSRYPGGQSRKTRLYWQRLSMACKGFFRPGKDR